MISNIIYGSFILLKWGWDRDAAESLPSLLLLQENPWCNFWKPLVQSICFLEGQKRFGIEAARKANSIFFTLLQLQKQNLKFPVTNPLYSYFKSQYKHKSPTYLNLWQFAFIVFCV